MRNLYKALYYLGWAIWLYCVIALLFGNYFPLELNPEWQLRYYLVIALSFPVSYWLMMFKAGFSERMKARKRSYLSEMFLWSVLLFPVAMLMFFANTSTTLNTEEILYVNKFRPQVSIIKGVWNYGFHAKPEQSSKLFKRITLFQGLNLIFETDTNGLNRQEYIHPQAGQVSSRLP